MMGHHLSENNLKLLKSLGGTTAQARNGFETYRLYHSYQVKILMIFKKWFREDLLCLRLEIVIKLLCHSNVKDSEIRVAA